jgi:hypothetical protein
MKTISSVIILVCLLVSCGQNIQKNPHKPIRTGGPCEYVKYPGTAKIISIEPAPYINNNHRIIAGRIKFIFTPDDLSERDKYSYSQWKDSCQYLTIGAGSNPSLAWIKKNNIKPGNIYKCLRCEETKGSCTPTTFEFPEINFSNETGSD